METGSTGIAVWDAAVAIGVMAVLLLVWLGVELAWRRVMGRGQQVSTCGGCQGCTNRCAERRANRG